jgi:hypothetical protein
MGQGFQGSDNGTDSSVRVLLRTPDISFSRFDGDIPGHGQLPKDWSHAVTTVLLPHRLQGVKKAVLPGLFGNARSTGFRLLRSLPVTLARQNP